MQLATIDKLSWLLIFGGMLSVSLGLSLQQGGTAFGWAFTVAGAVAAVVGGVLIFVRSRRS